MSGDLIKAAKLWSKVSAKTGRTYMVGRWGGCRVLIFENDKDGEGEPTHWLMIGAVEEGQEREPARRPGARDAGGGVLSSAPAANRSARPQERGDGWRGSTQYRRPANGAQRAPAATAEPFYEDSLEDIGRW